MIITRLSGGLGNQLFEYAMARRLADHHGVELLIDTSGYNASGEKRGREFAAFPRPLALFKFRVETRTATAEEIGRLRDAYYRPTVRDRVVRRLRKMWPELLWNPHHKVEKSYRFQPEALAFPDDVYLQGFWQSPKYFGDVESTIRRHFRLVDAAIEESASQEVAGLKARCDTVVSLHVRRGDLAYTHETLGRKNLTHGAPIGLEYIRSAMSRFEPGTCFFVFSDTPKDIEWCRQNISAANLEFSRCESDLWDFAAMSQCDHHIIANSSFSWWSAWLDPKANKRVIAPSLWSMPGATSDMPTDDLIPPEWEMI
jgi:hypothetical protein